MPGREGIAKENVAPTPNPKKESKNASLCGACFEPGSERTLEKYKVNNAKFAIKEISVNKTSSGNSDSNKNGHSVAFIIYPAVST